MTTPASDIGSLLDQLRTQLVEVVKERDGLQVEHGQLRERLSDMLSIVEDEGHVSSYVPQVTAARKVLAETALSAAARKAAQRQRRSE